MKQLLISLCCLLTLFSCKDEYMSGGPESNFRRASDSLFVVEVQGYMMQFALPKDLVMMYPPEIRFNAVLGQLEIRAGKHFMLDVSQDPFSIQTLKAELNQEQLFDYVFHEEGDDALTYEGVLPSGESYCYHHCARLNLSGQTYKVSTAPEGVYSEQHIEWVKNCISSMHSVH